MALAVYEGGDNQTTLAEFFENTADAIDFAVANGADVISMSIGACVEPSAYPDLAASVSAALASGVVLVASVGNFSSSFHIGGEKQTHWAAPCGSSTGVMLPAALPGVISVGATLETGARWAGSLTPTSADLDLLTVMAPGGDPIIPSTKSPPGGIYTDGYSGTSAAAPHVAGVAALILSLNASITPSEIRHILIDSADLTGCIKTDASIPTYGQECGAGRLDAYAALRLTLERHGGTLTQDVTIPAGETWNLGGVALEFASGAKLIVEGTLNASGTTFTATNPASGWEGLHFASGASGTFTDSFVSGVEVPNCEGKFGCPEGGAATVYDADLTLDGTTITGTVNGSGVLALGSSAYVTATGGSLIEFNARYGVKTTTGAFAIVGGGSLVRENILGGLLASGASVQTLESEILQNDGPGVASASGGYASLERGGGSGPGGSGQGNLVASGVVGRVVDNGGGLDAQSGASTQSIPVVCPQPPCASTAHEILRNALGGNFDARAQNGSSVFSVGNFWGANVTSEADLVIIEDGSSTVNIQPDPTAGGGSAAKGGGSVALGLAADAEQALAQADTSSAFTILVQAMGAVNSADDRRGVYSTAQRLFRRAGAAPEAAPLRAWVQARAEGASAARPWALRALAAADGHSPQAARQALQTLAQDYAGTAHEAWAWRELVTLAVENGRESGATTALSRLAASGADAETVGEAAALVLAAFPDATLSTLNAPETLAKADVSGPASLVAAPNPTQGAAEIRYSLDAAADVRLSVYDALGREVAVLARGPREAGAHTATLQTARLAPGLYVVRLAAGAGRATTTRLTVIR